MKHLSIITLILLTVACSQTASTEATSELGDLEHQFTISPAAKASFDQGLLLLHSFEYDDAREEFQKAKEADPTEVMAYWGLAMTEYKALWGLQDVEAGRDVMNQLGASKEERLGKAETPLEKDFWTGVEILFGEGELDERNKAYATHFEQVYDANPDNQEVAAFYALGLMWAGYDDQNNLNKSAEVAAGIIEENPTHPGALHYMIHANDDPVYAQIAINAANKYAKVAPDATHALHMPSHIYVALGMWNEVVSSNTDSYQASLRRVERKELDGKARGYHSMAWLHYGLLQQGESEKAADLLREMMRYYADSTASLSYLITMQNQQRIEAGSWPQDITPVMVDYEKLGLADKSGMHFFNSLMAFDNNDAATIAQEIATLESHLRRAALLVNEEGIAMCSAGPTRYAPSKEGMRKTNVVINQMNALMAQVNGEQDVAEAYLIKATELEATCTYDSGPPFIAYPSFEQYGDWLLAQNRAEDALEQFNQSLESRTNRGKALRGKLAALQALERLDEAAEVQEIISGFSTATTVASL